MRLTYGSLDLTEYPYSIVWGSDFGAPQNQTEALAFLLQDGEVELSDRASNRTLQFSVLVEGVDLSDCAENEAALIAESEKPRNTITMDPEDYAPATVYETFRGQVIHARDDDGEMARLRIYTVTVNAAPFARSATETVTPALPASGTTTVSVDTGSATTGWTGAVNGVATTANVVSGAVGITTASPPTAPSGLVTISLTRTGSITTSATPYLVVDYLGNTDLGVTDLAAYGDGVSLPRIMVSPSPTAGFLRATFQVAATSVSALRFDFTSSSDVAATRTFRVDQINRTDVKPSLGTSRQLVRTIAVEGSAPTDGSIAVEHASSALGDTLVYLWDDDGFGYVPPLRTSYTLSSGTVTADPTLLSGGRVTLSTALTLSIPGVCVPWGMYVVMARIRSTTGVSTLVDYPVSWSCWNIMGASHLVPIENRTTTVSLSGTTWANAVLGGMQLRRVALNDATLAQVVIQFPVNASIQLDEVYIFNRSIGSLISVECGTGSPAVGGPTNRLWIKPPTASRPRPLVMRGTLATGQDAFGAGAAQKSWDFPRIKPPALSVFTATSNATDASVTLSHYPRWHTHAAK